MFGSMVRGLEQDPLRHLMRASGRDELAHLIEIDRRIGEALSLVERESEAKELPAAPTPDHGLLVRGLRLEVDLLAHHPSHASLDLPLRRPFGVGSPGKGVVGFRPGPRGERPRGARRIWTGSRRAGRRPIRAAAWPLQSSLVEEASRGTLRSVSFTTPEE